MHAVHGRGLVASSGGRGELASAARERQGSRRSEGLSLGRVGRVSLNGFHLHEVGIESFGFDERIVLGGSKVRDGCQKL